MVGGGFVGCDGMVDVEKVMQYDVEGCLHVCRVCVLFVHSRGKE